MVRCYDDSFWNTVKSDSNIIGWNGCSHKILVKDIELVLLVCYCCGKKRRSKKRQLRKTSTGRKNFHKKWRFSKKNRKALTEMLVFTSFFKDKLIQCFRFKNKIKFKKKKEKKKINPNCVQQVF